MNDSDLETTYRLHLHRTIKASADQAFHAMADPDQLVRWFTTEAHTDLKKGGAYSNARGDRGVFLEIANPTRLTFTWDNPEHCPGSVVTLTFRNASRERVLVRLLHRELRSPAEVDHMRERWQWTLTNLKLFLEENRTISLEEWRQMSRPRGRE